ncbi:MAG: glycosyltransferase, partial [Oscillospiraceae bacterium]
MSKKQICILTSVHRHDDVRIYHKEAKSLKEAGYDVTILCHDFSGKDENGINFIKIKLPKNRFLRMIVSAGKFYKTAKKINADYYHFHDPELIPTGKKLAKTAKVIYDVHEDVPRQILTKPYLSPSIAKIVSKSYEKKEHQSVSKFFAVIVAE